MSKASRLAAILVILGAMGACPVPREPRSSGSRVEASQPVELSLPTVKGDVFHLSSLRGKVVLLNFFATWCVPCQQLFRRLLEVQSAFGRDQVAIVAVSVDRHRRLVEPFVDELHLPFPVLLATPSSLRSAGIGKVRVVPTTVILDRRGRPRHLHSRMVSRQTLGREVRALLAAKQ